MNKTENTSKGSVPAYLFRSVQQQWPWIVAGFIVLAATLVVGFYVVQFGELGISPESNHWGTFGDYVGGIVNPLIALGALLLLAHSIAIQRKELRDSGRALKEQAAHSRDMVYLTAMIAVLERQDRHLEWLKSELAKLPKDPQPEETMEVMGRRQGLRQSLKQDSEKHRTLRLSIDRLLEKLQSASEFELRE